ncbi:unnamed protein product, partial [Coregonus sp. 'balchen']
WKDQSLVGEDSREEDSKEETIPQCDKYTSTSLQKLLQRKVNKADKLVDQFIQDLNEINYTPFFDVESPYELALNIFQYLSRTELG